MAYMNKCIESRNVAILCYDNRNYNSCINRYYYSFYQNLMYRLGIKEIQLDQDICGGSHLKAFETFIDKVFRPVKRPKPKDVTKIRNTYKNFKNLRELADYKEIELGKEDADKAKKYYDKLNEQINNIM